MEKTNKQIILNCEKLERRFALLNNGRLEEYQIERDDDAPKPGNIYLGRIINLEPALQAAFVDIGAEKNAFLHYHEMLPGGDDLLEKKQSEEEIILNAKGQKGEAKTSTRGGRRRSAPAQSKMLSEALRRKKKLTVADIPEFFKPGMEILVQVVKGPIGTKGARVTTNMSIPGRYLVLMPYSENIGLSTRIEGGQERDRLRKILASLDVPEGMGLICRTVGEGQKGAFFKNDLELLLDYWSKIEKAMETRKAPVEVFTEPNLIDRTIRDFMTEEIGGIIVDDKAACKKITDTLKRIGGTKMANMVTFHNSPKPIFDQYRVNEQLREVFQREVRLPSGGYICVDETEALIAIDVNSGRSRKTGADQPEFILKTNLEAATEIARQLRLRNVGGLVVIDFIDMKAAKDREEVLRTMKKLVKDDRSKTKVLPLSKLGLMEMTRQREHESIQDQVYNPCPYCNGTGLVKSPVTMSVEIQRRLNSILRERRYRDVPVRVFMHPDVLARLRNEDAKLLTDIEDKYHNALSFRADPNLHYEEFRLVDPETGAELK